MTNLNFFFQFLFQQAQVKNECSAQTLLKFYRFSYPLISRNLFKPEFFLDDSNSTQKVLNKHERVIEGNSNQFLPETPSTSILDCSIIHSHRFQNHMKRSNFSFANRNTPYCSSVEIFEPNSFNSKTFSRGYASKVSKGKDKKKKHGGNDDHEEKESASSNEKRNEKGNKKKDSTAMDLDPSVIIAETRSTMNDFLDFFSKELSKLRTGRVMSGMLDHVMVDYYGENKNLNFLASVTVKDSQTLSVTLHDPNMSSSVEKGLRNSPMQLNPILEKNGFLVPIPPLTSETRQAMNKLIMKSSENAKINIRKARKEGLDEIKKSVSFSEDEKKRIEKEIQNLTDEFIKEVDKLSKAKEREISST